MQHGGCENLSPATGTQRMRMIQILSPDRREAYSQFPYRIPPWGQLRNKYNGKKESLPINQCDQLKRFYLTERDGKRRAEVMLPTILSQQGFILLTDIQVAGVWGLATPTHDIELNLQSNKGLSGISRSGTPQRNRWDQTVGFPSGLLILCPSPMLGLW